MLVLSSSQTEKYIDHQGRHLCQGHFLFSQILLPNCLWHYQLGTISKIIASESGAVPDSFQVSIFNILFEHMQLMLASFLKFMNQ